MFTVCWQPGVSPGPRSLLTARLKQAVGSVTLNGHRRGPGPLPYHSPVRLSGRGEAPVCCRSFATPGQVVRVRLRSQGQGPHNIGWVVGCSG